jgi:hypothetical protein
MDDWRRAQKALFTSIRLLGDSCVETDDSGHGHDAAGVLRDMVAHDATDFRVRIVGVGVVKFAFAWG